MSDVLVYVQWGGDAAVWYVFEVVRAWLAVHTVNTTDGNNFILTRNVPGKEQKASILSTENRAKMFIAL